jgi:branched-chain amino acid transport system substrate-binding protein
MTDTLFQPLRGLQAAVFALLNSLALLCLPLPVAAQDNELSAVIGVVGPATQARGQSTIDGVQFAVNQINQHGLHIKGKRITLKVLVIDDKNDLNLAVIGARAAVSAGVVGVVGHLTTDASIAAAAIYSKANIAQLSPTSAGRQYTNMGYTTVFQMLGHSGYTGKHLADEASRILHARRIMLIDNDTVLGKELAQSFYAAMVARGRREDIVESAQINAKSSDFNPLLAKIRSSAPDLIYFAGVMPQTSAFATRLQQLDIRTQLLLTGGARNPQFPARTEDYPEGVMLMEAGSPVEKTQDFKRLEKLYYQKFNSPLVPYTLFAYDAVFALVEAMKLTNSLDPHLLSPALHKIKFTGLSGPVSFTADGSAESQAYSLYRAEQGRWKLINTIR